MWRVSVVYLVAACGGSPDLGGTYVVTAHTTSAPTCDVPVDQTDPAYVVFEEGSIFGNDYFSYQGCNDAAATDCPFSAGFLLYAEEIEDGWRAGLFASSGGGGSCVLTYMTSDAVLRDGALTIDTVQHGDDSDRPEAECDPDTAQSLGTTMPCQMREHLEATAL